MGMSHPIRRDKMVSARPVFAHHFGVERVRGQFIRRGLRA
jgi:hypothetical protein